MTENKISELSALLEFYSNRATAHASYFVAFVFGLFTIFGLAQNVANIYEQRITLLILSWVVWLSGYYCLLNFGFYSFLAERIKNAIGGDMRSTKEIEEEILNDLVLNWRFSLIRGRVFLGCIKAKKRYEELKKAPTQPSELNWWPTRIESFFNLAYWIIFFLAFVAVFMINGNLLIQWPGGIFLGISFVVLILDLSPVLAPKEVEDPA